MSNERFFRFAILFEGGLAGIALIAGWLLGLRLMEHLRFDGEAWCFGFLAALPLLASYFILKVIPLKGLKNVERNVREFFQQYMERLSIGKIILIAAFAGLGEELLFRGLLQKGIQDYLTCFGIDGYDIWVSGGIIVAISILFGLAHAVSKTYFFLAFLVSVYLGTLFWLFDNLAVPVFVHSFYDFFVFLHLRFEDS